MVHPSFSALFPRTDARQGQYIGGGHYLRHDKQLRNFANDIRFREHLWRRSIFGMVFTFNRLPQYVVEQASVSEFQHQLTEALRVQCRAGCTTWPMFYDAEQNLIWEGRST